MSAQPELLVSAAEAPVLAVLAEHYHSEVEWHALPFRSIAGAAKVDVAAVPALVRSLAAKGFARFERGLFSDDGALAGSGYRCTGEGLAARYSGRPA